MAAIKTITMDSEEFNAVQELEILKPCRVKEEGSKNAKAYEKGAKVKVSGNDKLQLLSTGMAKIAGAKNESAK